ncbi:Hsp70 family protein [Chthonobacter rhizosphaerae]|uniref:Hsp70 family protein n=1 Tax=Chthonobacter rhizosphaerae TaxID=2735553 RepID=UPI0015EFC5CC|nr:Hsp70 family protein [Chthonobacter rhizosphaerae]
MAACGLDFGTSNTTLGVAGAGQPALVPLEGDADTIPSAIFYPQTGATRVGRAAVGAYVDGEHGRLMRSLKSVLGTALIDETTLVGRQRLTFRRVIADYLGTIKRRAETAAGASLDAVVHGRPVFFVDDDPAGDARAEATLHAIATDIGFREVSFQFEPIAASLDYERQIGDEQLALIADIGGGTSDFSIVRLGPDRRGRPDRAADILANDGVRIGGTDFDRLLSLGVVMPLLGYRSAMKREGLSVPSGYFHDLATWSNINRLYEPKTLRALHEVERDAADPGLFGRLVRVVEEERGHALAIGVEGAKIAVSEEGRAAVDLAFLEAGLAAAVERRDLVAHTETLSSRIAARVDTCLRQAGVTADAIDAVFLTGGSTRLEHVRAAILAAVPAARVVEGDTFGSVGLGLTVEAANRYG